MSLTGPNGPSGDGLPSSNHPGGVNASFVDSHAKFISESISPQVYAQIMTSNRNRSDLVAPGNVLEKDLPTPSDDAY